MRVLTRGLLAALLAVATLLPAGPAAASDAADFVLTEFPQPHPETYFDRTFGARRSGGRRHQGNDLMGEKLMPVVAVADGVVERVGESRRAGYYVIVAHEGGWESWYLHLNDDTPGTDDGAGGPEWAFAEGIEEGVTVEAGQLIGRVGDSGNAEWTAPHTHFELHHDGKVVNPYPYLEDAWLRLQREWSRTNEVA